jgi:hypothetical protein
MSSSGDGKLKLVFVHGFLGECSQTFKRFPSDLKLKPSFLLVFADRRSCRSLKSKKN